MVVSLAPLVNGAFSANEFVVVPALSYAENNIELFLFPLMYIDVHLCINVH